MCNNCNGQYCNNTAPTLDVSDEDTIETVDDISVADISTNDEAVDDKYREKLNYLYYYQ